MRHLDDRPHYRLLENDHEYYVFGKLILAHIGNYAFEDPAAMFVISAQYEFQQKPHSNALKASIEHFHLYNYRSEQSRSLQTLSELAMCKKCTLVISSNS